MSALQMTSAATDQDDQAREGRFPFDGSFGQRQEMSSIAGDYDAPGILGACEDILVLGISRKDIAQEDRFVSPMAQKVSGCQGHIVIQEKLQPGGPAICSAMSASISVRWSS